jgi:hypothetical protein
VRVRKDAPAPHCAVSALLAGWLIVAFLIPLSRVSAADKPAPAAQTPDPLAGIVPPTTEPVTTEIIEARRKDVRKAKEIDDETRTKVLDLYQQALDSLKAGQEFAAKTGD